MSSECGLWVAVVVPAWKEGEGVDDLGPGIADDEIIGASDEEEAKDGTKVEDPPRPHFGDPIILHQIESSASVGLRLAFLALDWFQISLMR